MVSASVPDIISDFLRIFNADYAPNVKVGFVDTTGKLYIQTLQVADIFMFLKALVHCQCNPNPNQPAMADWIIGLKLSLCHVLTIVPTFLPDSTGKSRYIKLSSEETEHPDSGRALGARFEKCCQLQTTREACRET
ncbi:hypothetical protein QQP08_022202 [Theobroma cacao]|nr:hypothetical protein QQP08_022202 [Theobroma cacao]